MTMSHKEALRAAIRNFGNSNLPLEESVEGILRDYLDARGLVMVPKKPTGDMRYILERECEYPFATYEEMLAAAPDPFGGE